MSSRNSRTCRGSTIPLVALFTAGALVAQGLSPQEAASQTSLRPLSGAIALAAPVESKAMAGHVLAQAGPGTTPLHRLYNATNGHHFYTSSAAERDQAVRQGFSSEGVTGHLFVQAASGTTPLYRLYNRTNGDHLYTTSAAERDEATRQGYSSEGVTGHVFAAAVPGTMPLYRLHNRTNGDHFYTTSAAERNDAIARSGYSVETSMLTVERLPKGAAPAGVTARAIGPAGITIGWTPSPGAKGYQACRKGQNGEWTACAELASNITSHTDNALYPATTYAFRVLALYPDAMAGASEVSATTMADQPISGLTAAMEGEAARLTWDAQPGAIGYCIVRDGKVCVSNPTVIRTTSYLDAGLAPGTYQYSVIAMYPSPDGGGTGDPLSLYGPGEPWTVAKRVTLTAPRNRGVYRISIPGFRVHHETWDDALQWDGKRDEVIARADVFRVDQKTNTIDTNMVSTRVMGDVNRSDWVGRRVKAGSASDLGGIMTGDDVPGGMAWQLRGQPGADSLPLVVWEGQLTRDSNTVVVVPTVWEYDGVQDAFNDWATWLHGVPGKLKSNETFKKMAGSTLELASLGLDIALDLPEDEVTGVRFLGFDTGKAKDRPIGMAKTPGSDGKPHFTFMPKAYVIDLAKAERELASTVGGKAGVIAVPYADDPYLWGNYEVYLKIERLSP